MSTDPSDKSRQDQRRLPADCVEDFRRELFFGAPPSQSNGSTRFRKGQSGNPKGRPRKERPEDQIDMVRPALTPSMEALLASSRRKVRIREDGENRDVPAYEAVVMAQIATATRGSAYAQDKLLARLERVEERRAQAIAADHALFERYITQCRQEEQAALKAGHPVPRFVPHPDDICLEPGRPVRIKGPATEEDASRVDAQLALRDQLILQAALEQKGADINEPLRPGLPGYAATLLMFMVDRLLPKRLQLAEDRIMLRLDRTMRLSNRQLLRDVRKGWRRLGCRAGRGATLPKDHSVRLAIEKLAKAALSYRAE